MAAPSKINTTRSVILTPMWLDLQTQLNRSLTIQQVSRLGGLWQRTRRPSAECLVETPPWNQQTALRPFGFQRWKGQVQDHMSDFWVLAVNNRPLQQA